MSDALVSSREKNLPTPDRESLRDPVATVRVEGAEGIVDQQERWLAGLGGDRPGETEPKTEGRRPRLAVRAERASAEVSDGRITEYRTTVNIAFAVERGPGE